MKRLHALLLSALALVVCGNAQAQLLQPEQPLDRIVAVVNDGVILQSELDGALAQVQRQFAANPQQLPPRPVLERQVLERLILMKLQVQRAEENGIRVSDTEVDAAVANIARQNKMTPDQLQQAIAQQGGDYAAFRKQIADQILVQRLRDAVLQGSVQVTDAEVNNLLDSPAFKAGDVELAQILIAVPEAATPDQVAAAQAKAVEVEKALAGGLDFTAAAIRYSQAPDALEGGKLGWRRVDELPTQFADLILKMKPGEVTPPLRSPDGFHIIKLVAQRAPQKQLITEYHARQILIKTSELVSSEQAQQKIAAIRKQIVDGKADFSVLAKMDSGDDTTANAGGDMGWFPADQFGTVVAQLLPTLKDNEISQPFQTPQGWHILQLLGSRQVDRTEAMQREQARQAIGNRKAEESYSDFLRDLRAQAYVRILLGGAGEAGTAAP